VLAFTQGSRPELPTTRTCAPLENLVRCCWDCDVSIRPSAEEALEIFTHQQTNDSETLREGEEKKEKELEIDSNYISRDTYHLKNEKEVEDGKGKKVPMVQSRIYGVNPFGIAAAASIDGDGMSNVIPFFFNSI